MINVLLSLYNFDEEWCVKGLKDIIQKEHKVVIIPFSFHDEWMKSNEDWQMAYNKLSGNYYKDIVSPFISYGIIEENIDWINYFEDTIENAKQKIDNSDILFFTGGLPDKMMNRLEEFDLINCIENYEGIVIGSSAGAMIQINEYHISPDKDYDIFSYNKGLNLIKDFDIEVHYENTKIQNEAINKVVKDKGKKVYAIGDKGAVIIKNGEVSTFGEVRIF
jgi:peptidase E